MKSPLHQLSIISRFGEVEMCPQEKAGPVWGCWSVCGEGTKANLHLQVCMGWGWGLGGTGCHHGPSCSSGPLFCPLVGFSQLGPNGDLSRKQVLQLSFFQCLPCRNLEVKIRGRCSNQEKGGSSATRSLTLILRRLPFPQRECALCVVAEWCQEAAGQAPLSWLRSMPST